MSLKQKLYTIATSNQSKRQLKSDMENFIIRLPARDGLDKFYNSFIMEKYIDEFWDIFYTRGEKAARTYLTNEFIHIL